MTVLNSYTKQVQKKLSNGLTYTVVSVFTIKYNDAYQFTPHFVCNVFNNPNAKKGYTLYNDEFDNADEIVGVVKSEIFGLDTNDPVFVGLSENDIDLLMDMCEIVVDELFDALDSVSPKDIYL